MRCIYIYIDKIKYVLIQYFMWTIKNHNIYNIYLFAKKKKKKKKKKEILTIFTKLFIVS